MQKVQVFLREDQKAALKAISVQTGQKQSDLIRRSVDLLIDKANAEQTDWRDAVLQATGIWKEHTDLEERLGEFRRAASRRFERMDRP